MRGTSHLPDLRLWIGRANDVKGPFGRNRIGLSYQDHDLIRLAGLRNENRISIIARSVADKHYQGVWPRGNDAHSAVCIRICALRQDIRRAEECAVA